MKNFAKRTVSLFLSFLFIISCFVAADAVAVPSTGITSAKTPTSKAKLVYAKKMGAGYASAPTTPVISGSEMIVYSSGKLYKLKASTGEVIKSVTTAGTNRFTVASPTVANGMIFLQMDNGMIQAFNYKTMKSLWVYKDSIGGQALTNIAYSGGYIYTGFWQGETSYANYVCISVKDQNIFKTNESKKATWTYKRKGGFYQADCCVSGNYVVFGCDNGTSDYTSNSAIVSLNKKTGKKISGISVAGDIRSGISYDSTTKRYYVTSKAGYLYSFTMTSEGKLGSKKYLALSGSATAAPVAYKGRVYFGASDGSTGGNFYVVNGSTLKTIYTSALPGCPQGKVLVSGAYSGKVYIYLTVNATPGSVYMFKDTATQTTAKKTLLYSPDSAHSQYCISDVVAGSDGRIYYKNDSATIFALKAA